MKTTPLILSIWAVYAIVTIPFAVEAIETNNFIGVVGILAVTNLVHKFIATKVIKQ